MKKIFVVISLMVMALALCNCENKGGGDGGETVEEKPSYAQFNCSAVVDALIFDYIAATVNITRTDGSYMNYPVPTEANGLVGDIPVFQIEYEERSQTLPATVVLNFVLTDNGAQIGDMDSAIDAYLASVLEINVYNALGQVVNTERQENVGEIQKDIPIGMIKQYLKFVKTLSLDVTLSVDEEGKITVTIPDSL